MQPHQPPVVRGAGRSRHARACAARPAMGRKTSRSSARPTTSSIPGHPEWHVAPIEMAWEGKSLGEICEQIKDPNATAARTWPSSSTTWPRTALSAGAGIRAQVANPCRERSRSSATCSGHGQRRARSVRRPEGRTSHGRIVRNRERSRGLLPPKGSLMNITINGEARDFDVDIRTSLLDLLRNHLGLTGTKKGCDHGQCGACTILLNGVRINSCLTLAVMHEGDDIVTVRGWPRMGLCIRCSGPSWNTTRFQCGYCTPGQICSAVGMLGEFDRGLSERRDGRRRRRTGVLRRGDPRAHERQYCRCGAFPNIVDAIRAASTGPGRRPAVKSFTYSAPPILPRRPRRSARCPAQNSSAAVPISST